MSNELKEEVQSANLTPQSIPMETEVNSSAPVTNDNTNTVNNQDSTNTSKSSVDVFEVIEPPLDKVTPPSFRENSKLDTYGLAKYLVEKHFVINLHGMLYIYNEGIYEHNTRLIDSLILDLASGAKPAEKKAVYSDLMAIAPVKTESSYHYIAFNNCIVDIRGLKVIQYSDVEPYDYIITSKVYANYDLSLIQDVNSALEFVKSFFDVITCGNSGLKILLFEIIVYAMLRTAKYQLGFLLKGTSNNGKSDYIHIIESLLGKYCTHQTLTQLSKPKSLMALYGCTANIVDDTCEIKKIDFAQIQSIISGGTLSVDFNGTEDFSFAPYNTLILATNHYLCFKGCHKELTRRFLVIPFTADLDNCSDVDMTENICSQKHLDIIATLALQMFHKVVIDKHFHIPEVVSSCTKTFFLQANPVLEFIKSHPINRLVSKSDYFADFCRWCNRNNIIYNEISSTFGPQVIDYGYEPKPHSIDGVKDTFYQKLGYNMQELRQEYEAYCNSLDSSDKPMKLSRYILYLYEQDIDRFEQSEVQHH